MLEIKTAFDLTAGLVKSSMKAFATHFGKAAGHHEAKVAHHGDMSKAQDEKSAAFKALAGLHKDMAMAAKAAGFPESMQDQYKAAAEHFGEIGKGFGKTSGYHEKISKSHGRMAMASKAMTGLTDEAEKAIKAETFASLETSSDYAALITVLKEEAAALKAQLAEGLTKAVAPANLAELIKTEVAEQLKAIPEPITKGLSLVPRAEGAALGKADHVPEPEDAPIMGWQRPSVAS